MIGTLDDDLVDAETIPPFVDAVIATGPGATIFKSGILVGNDAHEPTRRVRACVHFPPGPHFRRGHGFVPSAEWAELGSRAMVSIEMLARPFSLSEAIMTQRPVTGSFLNSDMGGDEPRQFTYDRWRSKRTLWRRSKTRRSPGASPRVWFAARWKNISSVRRCSYAGRC